MIAETLVDGVQVYAGIGVAVASLFLTFGVGAIDASARGAYLFRILAIPGVVLLWPIVLWRWGYIAGRQAAEAETQALAPSSSTKSEAS